MDNRVGYLLVPTYAVPAPIPIISIPTYPISAYQIFPAPIIMQPPGIIQLVDNSFNNICSWQIAEENGYMNPIVSMQEFWPPWPPNVEEDQTEAQINCQSKDTLKAKEDSGVNNPLDDVKTQRPEPKQEPELKEEVQEEIKESDTDKHTHNDESISISDGSDFMDEGRPISGKNHQSKQIRWKKINDK